MEKIVTDDEIKELIVKNVRVERIAYNYGLSQFYVEAIKRSIMPNEYIKIMERIRHKEKPIKPYYE
jgi:hypothetical protein